MMVKPVLVTFLCTLLFVLSARASSPSVSADGDASSRVPEPEDAPPATPNDEAASGELRRFALVAGTNEGGADRVPLRFAVSDARAMTGVLTELGGVAPGDVLFLENPSRAELEAAFDAMDARLGAARQAGRVELLFYYSGHSDERGLLLGEARLPYRELRSRIDALSSDVRIVVLDSCASGALTRLKGGTMRPPFLVDAATDVRGHAFLTSASADEAAQESDRLGGSFFTHALVSGLRGAADANLDGKVTLNEAYQFAFEDTLRRTETTRSGPQHASYDIQLAGSGDLVMTDLRAGDAALLLPDELAGRVFVRGARGQLVAELDKREGRGLHLSLPAGEYDVLVEENGRAKGARVTLLEGASQPLDPRGLSPREKELATTRGPAFAASLVQSLASGARAEGVGEGELALLRERGTIMLAGGSTSAALGGCCLSVGLVSFGLGVMQGDFLGNCTLGGAACILLGGVAAAFGAPVAWLGMEKLDEAEGLAAEARTRADVTPESVGDELPAYAY